MKGRDEAAGNELDQKKISFAEQAAADQRDVRRVVSGDVEAFAGIVNRHQQRLLAFGRRYFRNIDDAEDFVQEVFLRAFRRLDSFRGEGRFFSWLMSVAYNLAVRTADRRPSFDELDELVLQSPLESPGESLLRAEARSAVVDAIGQLPARYRSCVDMYFFFDLTYQEISDSTGYPLNTVRSHIRRAKLLLKASLADHALEAHHELR